MTSFEMICYLDDAWRTMQSGNPVTKSMKSILKVMQWQPAKARQQTVDKIAKREKLEDSFIEFVESMIKKKMQYQRRLF